MIQHKVKTNCKFCRVEFYAIGLKKVCPQCEASIDETFRRIRDHLEENPDDGMQEICDALRINTNIVKYFLREDRLRIKRGNNNYFLKCLRCGEPIYSGRYCLDCEIAVVRDQSKDAITYNDDFDSDDVLRVARTTHAFHSSKRKR